MLGQKYKFQKNGSYQNREKTYGEMLFDHTIKPYLDHFIQVFEHLWAKVIIGLLVVMAAGWELGRQLFQTPDIWVYGIAILIALDFASGTLRALTDSKVKFSIKIWVKTAWKIAAFSMAIAAVVVGSNMFPTAFGWIQYVVYALLASNEIYSILTNLKLTALAEVLWDMMTKKVVGDNDFESIKKEMDRRADEKFQQKHEEDLNKYELKD